MNKPDIYFVITIDTEADHSPDWTKSDPLTFKSITEAIPNRLEPLFKKYGAIGTYLLTTELLESDEALRTIKSLNGKFELGTHLHPEFIEPEKQHFKYAGTRSRKFSHNYSPEIEKAKINAITRLFEKKTGYLPKVYRGGKFGFDYNTAFSLAGLGYLVDTSVTPRVSWQDINGPDFRNCSDQPYFIKSTNGQRCLLEVPVSIVYLNRIARFFNRPTWLRPSFSKVQQMKKLIDNFIQRYRRKSVIVLNMMFHSMEFYPRASPYSLNQEDCDRLLCSVEDVLRYCKDNGIKFCRLSEIKNLYST